MAAKVVEESGVGSKPPTPEKKSMPFLMRFQHAEGLLICSSIFYFGYYYFPPLLTLPVKDDFSNKLLYVMYCSILPCCSFLFAINAVLKKRRSELVINPLRGREHLLQVEHNFAQNTLEQLVVFLISTAILATYLIGEELKLVALNAVVFTVGRILFRIGYGIHPKYRGVGVACSFTGQIVILGLCVYYIYTKGIMYGLEEATTTQLPTTSPGIPKHEL